MLQCGPGTSEAVGAAVFFSKISGCRGVSPAAKHNKWNSEHISNKLKCYVLIALGADFNVSDEK
jgi:hypothetical protein